MFLIPQDYEAIIRAEILGTISGGDQYNIDAIELAATSEMQGYLRARFDLLKIFFHVLPYNTSTQFSAGQYCYHSVTISNQVQQMVFRAKQHTTNQVPALSGSAFWELRDDRHPLIKMYLVDMTVYHLHAALPPRMIPELREVRYQAALAWLKMVRDGLLVTDLPVLSPPPDEAGNLYRLGSNPKMKHIW